MKLSEVVSGIEGELIKDGTFEKMNFCTSNAQYPFLTFMEKPKFVHKMSKYSVCALCTRELVDLLPNFVEGVFVTDNPKYDFYRIHNRMTEKQVKCPTKIDDSAVISEKAFVAGQNVVIGKNVIIEPNVCIHENVVIGDNVIIHSNAVIGGRSFDFAKSSAGDIVGWIDAGWVQIEDDVEICSSAHIAQACLEEDVTLLEEKCKIDANVYLAHGVHVGKRTMIAGGACVGGNCIIGNESWIGLNATVSNRITIGNNARVSLGAVVTKNVGDNTTVSGNFAIEHASFLEHVKAIAKNNL